MFFLLLTNKSTNSVEASAEDSKGTVYDDTFFLALSLPISRTSRISFSFESSPSLLRLKPLCAESDVFYEVVSDIFDFLFPAALDL